MDAQNLYPCPSVSQDSHAARNTDAYPNTATAPPSAPLGTQTTHSLLCTSTVVVTCLSFKSKDKDIREHFRRGHSADQVVKIRLQPGDIGGTAVVEFESVHAATCALRLHGSVLQQKTIGVVMFNPPGLTTPGEVQMDVYQCIVRE